jgi:hypothetical protein
MAEGDDSSKSKLKRFGRWGSLLAFVAAFIAVAANVDGTLSLAERAGRVVGIGDSSGRSADTVTPSVTSLSTTPTSTPSTEPSTTPTSTLPTEPSTTPTSTPATKSPASTPATPVRAWYYLADLAPISTTYGPNCTGGCTGFRSGPGSLGEIFAQSYLMRASRRGGLGTSTWNALRACTTFDATVGLDDRSDSATARFTITPDGGNPVVVASVSSGEPKRIHFKLDGVYRFTLGTNLTKAQSFERDTVWGDARVYCTDVVKQVAGSR